MMSSDFVLMRLVSSTGCEEDPVGSEMGKRGLLHHHHHHHLQHLQHGLSSAGASEKDRDGAVGQLMVLQNLLGPGDPGPDGPEPEPGQPGPGEVGSIVEAPSRRFEWGPVLRLSKVSQQVSGSLCPRLISDTPGWTPLGTHKPTADPVLDLARRLGELGKDGDVPLCTCPGVPGDQPGEDPSETSDALLVLEGLGGQEVEAGCQERSQEEAESKTGQEQPCTFSSSSLSGLMDQVHRLTREACCETRAPTGPDGTALQTSGPAQEVTAPVQTPHSRPPTPRHVGSPLTFAACGGHRDTGGQSKSRKGSLKMCLSKLFRTKSRGSRGSSSSLGHTTDKRPSLASSTSSGGSLVDVWGSGSTDPGMGSSRAQLARPRSTYSPVPFSGETVSLVDVDVSHRVNSLNPPTPPPPPRRSLSLLEDFGGPQPGRLHSNGRTTSTQMLTHTHASIQHSLSDTLLRVPRPRPLQPDDQSASLVERRPLLLPPSRPDPSGFATSLRELEKCGWYWGPMNWEDAEMKLKGKADGSFLVRDSSDPRYILSLSFRSQGITHHTRMEHYRGTFSLWCHPKFEDRCHSVVEFIERAIMHSKNGRFLYFLRSRVPGVPPTPVQLLYPVSRFISVKSLQHLCRFCIRQLVRIDHIAELPLPIPLIVYLRKFYFYDPEEEEYLSIKESGRDRGATQEVESQT